jgi:murein L,D-transpeptidase YafK
MQQRRKQFRVVTAVCVGMLWCLPAAWCAGKKDGQLADRIVIVKSEHTMTVLRQGQVLKTYKVALGHEPRGAKTRLGDNKTPEGEYVIDSRNAHSQFHLSLHISYPSPADRDRAKKLGVDPGGQIMIHGLPPAYAWLGPLHRKTDWTLGCIAVTDSEIEEIWTLVPVGTKVEIKP